MDLGITGVAAITAIAYLIGQICKTSSAVPNRWIPVICGCAGAVLGLVGLKVMPDFPAADALTAIAVGAVSGLGATGVNQAWKQLTQKDAEQR